MKLGISLSLTAQPSGAGLPTLSEINQSQWVTREALAPWALAVAAPFFAAGVLRRAEA